MFSEYETAKLKLLNHYSELHVQGKITEAQMENKMDKLDVLPQHKVIKMYNNLKKEELLTYTNLELEINFVNEKSEVILREIAALLKKHGYEQHSSMMGWDESGTYQRDQVVFYPKECL